MSFSVTVKSLRKSNNPALKGMIESVCRASDDDDVNIDLDLLDADEYQALKEAISVGNEPKALKALEWIEQVDGDFTIPVPNFKAFLKGVRSYLSSNVINGWVFVEHVDGKLYPELVVSIASSIKTNGFTGRDDKPVVTINTLAFTHLKDGGRQTFGPVRQTHKFYAGNASRSSIPKLLANKGIYKETTELINQYSKSLDRYWEIAHGKFAEQFRISGQVHAFEDSYSRNGESIDNAKAIHDLVSKDKDAMMAEHDSDLISARNPELSGSVPIHPLVKFFNLKTHEYFWINSDYIQPYIYDKSLGDKLILPETHRDLLDVLTTNIHDFVEDFVEGKSAGNVILCKGSFGLGKTLSAEVFAELMERPLYLVNAGELGTDAYNISKNLKAIFELSNRWNCVLLLDEADVFVMSRGNNIEANAIVAEFLRTLEYFPGLLFLTTNRPNDIDDAIISRAAAIIQYEAPTPDNARKIWKVMAEQFKDDLSESLLDSLLELFPSISPRDIKMLYRLALRVAKSRNEALSIDTFRQCAMFRAIKME